MQHSPKSPNHENIKKKQSCRSSFFLQRLIPGLFKPKASNKMMLHYKNILAAGTSAAALMGVQHRHQQRPACSKSLPAKGISPNHTTTQR